MIQTQVGRVRTLKNSILLIGPFYLWVKWEMGQKIVEKCGFGDVISKIKRISYTWGKVAYCFIHYVIIDAPHLILLPDDEPDSHKAPPPQKPARRKPRQNRSVPRGQHHNRGAGFHSNYHAHPHFPPPDFMFPHPDPHLFPFQGPMYPLYPRPPPPFHMGMPPWLPGANQGFMFQPPPPPPPPPSNQ